MTRAKRLSETFGIHFILTWLIGLRWLCCVRLLRCEVFYKDIMAEFTWVFGFYIHCVLQTLHYWDWSLVMKCLIWPGFTCTFLVYVGAFCSLSLCPVTVWLPSCHLLHVDISVCHNFLNMVITSSEIMRNIYDFIHFICHARRQWHSVWQVLQWHKPSSCGWIACHIDIHIVIGPVVWGVTIIVECVRGASCTVATARSL